MRALAAATLTGGFAAAPASAQDATWKTSPGSAVYGTATNWSTGTVPTGTAFFGASSTGKGVVRYAWSASLR